MSRALACLLVALGLAALGAAPAQAIRLVRFGSCAQLTKFARGKIVTTGGDTGVPYRVPIDTPAPLRQPGFVSSRTEGVPVPAAAAPDSAASGGGADTSFSTTNVQEQ